MTDAALALPKALSRTWVVGWWAAGRAAVLVTALVMHAVGPRGLVGPDERTHLLGVLGSWDGRWYRTVAANGYLLEPGRQSDPAFFPFYPMLLRALNAFGIGYVTGGVVLSQLAFLAALFAFATLTRDLFDETFAERATIYLALFPMGFVFSMAYPESIVLLAIALAAVAAARRHWSRTGALAGLGALARPETLFLSIPLAARAWREPDRRGSAFGAVAAPFAALASFALYLQVHLHDPLAWTHAERAWGRSFTPLGLVRAVEHLPSTFAGNAWIVRDVVFFAVYLVLLWLAWRRGAPKTWVVAGALIVVLPTFSGSFHSVGRFGLLAPAIVWGLASLGERRPRVDLAIRTASLLLLVGGTVSLAYVFP